MNPHQRRWLAVCLLPPLLAAVLAWRGAADAKTGMLHGIMLVCAAVFLFKYVLFALIGAHLRHDLPARRQAALQMLPLAAFALYIVYYFVR